MLVTAPSGGKEEVKSKRSAGRAERRGVVNRESLGEPAVCRRSGSAVHRPEHRNHQMHTSNQEKKGHNSNAKRIDDEDTKIKERQGNDQKQEVRPTQ